MKFMKEALSPPTPPLRLPLPWTLPATAAASALALTTQLCPKGYLEGHLAVQSN